MRIFMTGASGYIGRVVAEKAIRQGHQVLGLARSAEAAAKLEHAGVVPVAGTLQSHGLLAEAAADADGVIHLGLDHGGTASFAEVMALDKAVVRALADGLARTDKGLVTTSGTGVVAPHPQGDETDETSPLGSHALLALRASAEADALSLALVGVRVSAIRLPPFVYGRGGSSLVPMMLKAGIQHGVSPYVGDGTQLTSAVHVDEAAELYLQALKQAPAGTVFNATTETDISLRALAETIGSVTGTPVLSVSRSEAEAMFGPFVTTFLATGNRASSLRARQLLGWRPQPQRTLLDDMAHGSYLDFVQRLRQDVASR